MKRLSKQLLFSMIGVLILFSIGAVQAVADSITFSGNTSATFGAGTSGGTVSSGGSSITIGASTITYSSNANEINVTNLQTQGDFSNVTLGVFKATSGDGVSVRGATVTLIVTFTAPAGLSPNSLTYTGRLNGEIRPGPSGAAVFWDAATLSFGAPGVGTFTLKIEDFTPINSPSSPDASRVRGILTFSGPPPPGPAPAPVPEPLTMLTLGSGLAGLAALRSRRRKK